MGIYRGELPSGNPSFPDGDAAIRSDAKFPVDISAPDIVYTSEDDKAIDKFHRDVGMWPV
jgi:alcohol oxidase